jgi:hypothetical protein
VGGAFLFNHPGYVANSHTLVVPKKGKLDFTYKYSLSYQLRFQLVDKNGNWAEFQTGVAKLASFSASPRYQHLFNTIQDRDGSKVEKVLTMDQPKNGDITILRDILPGAPGPTFPKGDAAPKGLVAPFWTTYWFNPTGGDYGVTATLEASGWNEKGAKTSISAPKKGQVVFTDLDGLELGRLPNRRNLPIKIPAGSVVRVLYVPDDKGVCYFGMTLTDAAAHDFNIYTNFGKIWAATEQHWFSTCLDATTIMVPPQKAVVIETLPGAGDLTFKGDLFPDWEHDPRNKNKDKS